jgi:hypothetical protein
VLEDVFVRPIRSARKLPKDPDSLLQKLIHVYRDVNADETPPSVSLFIFISSLFSNHLDLTTSKMAALDIRTPKTRRGVICTGIRREVTVMYDTMRMTTPHRVALFD